MTVAAHLRTFLKECGSFAHTIFPGKSFHLRTQFPQVNVTFAHIYIFFGKWYVYARGSV